MAIIPVGDSVESFPIVLQGEIARGVWSYQANSSEFLRKPLRVVLALSFSLDAVVNFTY
jgi:hypothetical protein